MGSSYVPHRRRSQRRNSSIVRILTTEPGGTGSSASKPERSPKPEPQEPCSCKRFDEEQGSTRPSTTMPCESAPHTDVGTTSPRPCGGRLDEALLEPGMSELD